MTLSGAVDNDAERTAASRYAAAAPGVKKVINNLQISVQPAPADAAQAEPEPAPPKLGRGPLRRKSRDPATAIMPVARHRRTTSQILLISAGNGQAEPAATRSRANARRRTGCCAGAATTSRRRKKSQFLPDDRFCAAG